MCSSPVAPVILCASENWPPGAETLPTAIAAGPPLRGARLRLRHCAMLGLLASIPPPILRMDSSASTSGC